MKILVVEDDQKTAEYISRGLGEADFCMVYFTETRSPTLKVSTSMFSGSLMIVPVDSVICALF
ncbi:hypothetical protein [Rhizobium sp. SG741]|uniref:hypothetical protein n=1 Tax=Rhizobium sp. SG741 TaxID=2587114 RepID=UPI0017FF15F5|nr:hypothetical protein [Rhizobium sp. SG741]NKJ04309.1 DNA-binding response OmpR family regulator [Rhizobium sp. SG741]